MAVTRPDISVSSSSYVDAFSLSGITPGTTLILQNKSTVTFYVQIRETAPPATSTDGVILRAYKFLEVKTTGAERVWVRGAGKLSVQIKD